MGAECLATLVASLEERMKKMEKENSMKFISLTLEDGSESLLAIESISCVLIDPSTDYTCFSLNNGDILKTTHSLEDIKTKLSIVGVSMA